MEKTGIIWTEHSWNPIRARHKTTKSPGWFCTKVNEGCKFCYAEELNKKFGNGLEYTIPNLKKIEFYLAAMSDPAKWLKKFGGSLIFPCSMTDFFHENVPDEFRHMILDVVEKTPEHEYQFLTKRPEIMYRFSLQRRLPKNFWAGMTIPDDKARLQANVADLKKTKAEIHWISAEPLIGELNFTKDDLDGIDLVVTGGESGTQLWKEQIAERRALVRYDREQKSWQLRKDREPWLLKIRDICSATNTHFFHKQHGGNYPEAAGRLLDGNFYSDLPRYPGNRTSINNDYLKKIEGKTQTLF